MTRQEANALYDSGEWRKWTFYERIKRQLFEERLIMPFEEFKRAADFVFSRPMSTSSLAEEFVKEEFLLLDPAQVNAREEQAILHELRKRGVGPQPGKPAKLKRPRGKS